MGSRSSRWFGITVNVALVVLGLITAFLAYGMVMRLTQPRVDPVREANPAQLIGEIIQVEVRNGCGISGLAGRTTMYLRKRGFDVVEVGDYTSFNEEHSMVIDRVGDLASAAKVAHALGIPEERIIQEIRPGYFLDASVVIGEDYQSLRPFAVVE